MNAVDFVNLCRSKRAAALMTPEAMQAAAQPPMPTPGMPPAGGAPMDPAMMGAPAGAPPMDPAMMGAAPMPPQGAPPMDPAMMGAPAGAPPAGGMQMDPAAILQMFIEFAASQGITLDPQTGGAFDANGQPVPPEVIQQLMMQFEQMLAQGGGMPPAGAPMDPAMAGAPAGAPPMDPAMMGAPAGAPPMDPAMGGMPPEGAMPPEAAAPADPAALLEEVRNSVLAMVKAELAAQDNKITAMMLKMDAVKGLLEQLIGTKDQRNTQEKEAEADLDSMIQQELAAQGANAQPAVAPAPAVDQLAPKQASETPRTISLLQKMRGIHG